MATTRYSCPLDGCRWYYDEDTKTDHWDAPGYDNSNPNAVKITSLFGLRDKTERELERHLETHPRVDFLVTIKNLRQQLAGGLLTP